MIKKENRTTTTFNLNDKTIVYLQYNKYQNGIAMGKTIELAIEEYIQKHSPGFDYTKYLEDKEEEE